MLCNPVIAPLYLLCNIISALESGKCIYLDLECLLNNLPY